MFPDTIVPGAPKMTIAPSVASTIMLFDTVDPAQAIEIPSAHCPGPYVPVESRFRNC